VTLRQVKQFVGLYIVAVSELSLLKKVGVK
jgi:hypothetical protein